jgi:hypothetical protein
VEEQISKLKKQNAKIVLATHSYACEHNAIFRENLLTLFRNLKNRGCHFTGISDLL